MISCSLPVKSVRKPFHRTSLLWNEAKAFHYFVRFDFSPPPAVRSVSVVAGGAGAARPASHHRNLKTYP